MDEYQELLRCSVAFAGNDHRLGAQEAPPAIISVFLGDELQTRSSTPSSSESDYTETERKDLLRIGVDVLPSISAGHHRPQPYLARGLHRQQVRVPYARLQPVHRRSRITVLNTIMAEELQPVLPRCSEEAPDFNKALHDLVRKAFIEHGRIIFNGNGYEEAWVEEAARRGLANLRSTADALPTYVLPKNVELMMKHGVYTKEEMLSRHEIHMEKYRKVITHRSGHTLVDMVQHEILNAASRVREQALRKTDRCASTRPRLSSHLPRREVAGGNSIGILNDKLLEQTVTLKTAHGDRARRRLRLEEEMRYYHDVVASRYGRGARKTVDQSGGADRRRRTGRTRRIYDLQFSPCDPLKERSLSVPFAMIRPDLFVLWQANCEVHFRHRRRGVRSRQGHLRSVPRTAARSSAGCACRTRNSTPISTLTPAR